MASNNSLPTMTSGCSGRLAMVSCQTTRSARIAERRPSARSVSRGLVSTMATSAPGASAGVEPPRVRSMSFISVPRPGPISASVTGSGRPIACQALEHPDADQLAEHLADLRRGDEVAGCAERLARRVVAVVGIEQADRHVVGDRQRAVRPRSARRSLPQPRQAVQALAVAAAGLAVAIAQMPTSTIGADSTMPMVSQPPSEIADLLVRLAEEFDEDARQPVAGDEGAADEAGRSRASGSDG